MRKNNLFSVKHEHIILVENISFFYLLLCLEYKPAQTAIQETVFIRPLIAARDKAVRTANTCGLVYLM